MEIEAGDRTGVMAAARLKEDLARERKNSEDLRVRIAGVCVCMCVCLFVVIMVPSECFTCHHCPRYIFH